MFRALPALLAAAAFLTGASPVRLLSQETEEDSVTAEDSVSTEAAARDVPAARQAAGGRQARCTLTLEPEEETVLQRYAQGEDTYITHVGGGMTWRCGTAVMQADSAVKYDVGRRVQMIGSVRYRDTIRTLRSQRLDYYEIGDRVVATGNVLLTRLESGSTLRAPRVEFLRAVSGIDERTIAEGRPHMTLYTDSARRAPPFEVDADRTEFAGEDIAEAWGDVVIERPDVRARADSAYFDLEDGLGILYGDPWARGEGFELTGDTIRLGFREDALREVHAIGDGEALGEEYRVRAARIDASIREEQVEAVWAHGPGRSVAISRPYRLLGDSVRFVLSEGRMDTIVAVGRAIAVEEEAAAAVEDSAGLAGDSTGAAPDSAGVRPDSVGAGPAAPDSVPAEAADSVPTEADSVATGAGPGPRAETDSTEAGASGEVGPAPPEVAEPRLGVDAQGNWMIGDTLYAIFSEGGEPGAGEDSTAAGRDSTAAGEGEEPEGPGEAAEEAAAAAGPGGEEGAPVPPDTSARRVLSRLRIIGAEADARAYYTLQDSTGRRTGARNYLIGRTIDVFFREGRPDRVVGTRAIGVYLDPAAGAGPGGPGGPAGRDTAGAPPDSAAPEAEAARDTGAVRDTAAVPDTTWETPEAGPPDTATRRPGVPGREVVSGRIPDAPAEPTEPREVRRRDPMRRGGR